MTPEEKIARLKKALQEPEGTYTHAQIREKIDSLGGGSIASRAQPITSSFGKPPEVAAKQTAMERLKEGVSTIGEGIGAIGTAIRHPIDTFTNPARVSQMARGVDDMLTFGYGQKLADKANQALGREPSFAPSAEQMDDESRFRTGGQLVGSALPGAAKTTGKLGVKAAEKALGRVPAKGMIPGAGMGAAKAVVGYELSAPVIAAAHADAGGLEDRVKAAERAASDPLGLAMSVTGGAVGGAGKGKAAAIRDPKTRSGQVLKDFEQAGPGAKIRPFGDEPVAGGLYESPALKNLPHGKEGKNLLASQSAEKVAGANQARLKAARAQWGDTVDQILTEHGDARHPMANAHKALDAMEGENTINGVVGDEGVHRAIGKVRKMLTVETPGQLDPEATIAKFKQANGLPPTARLPDHIIRDVLGNPGQAAVMTPGTREASVSAGDHVKARKLVRALADQAPDPSEKRVYKMILGSMDKDAMAVDPRIVELNRNYSAALKPADAASRITFGKRTKSVGGPDGELTESERTTGTRRLGSIGEDTQMATVRRVGDRLSRVGPEYEREVRLLRAKNAQEQLRPGQNVSTQLEKGLAQGRGRLRATSLVAALAGRPLAWLAGAGIDALDSNQLGRQVRKTLPVSEAVGKRFDGRLGSTVGASDELSRAARKRGKKKRQSVGAEMSQEGERL